MTKENNPGWPDPTDWALRLHDVLEKIGADYHSTPWEVANDPEEFAGLNLKQARAAEALLAIHTALRELPPFEKSKGAAVLHDVAGALRDVVMGGSPRLFKSARPGGPGGDGIHRNYVKVFVVLAVRFLREAHGLSEGAARTAVAERFSQAGATGRKGNPLSASTVKEWCDKAHPLSSNHEDVRIHERVEARLQEFRDDPHWPGDFDEALAWIERIASDPLLSSKYG
ncbi:hypothetical protein OZN62_09180 [Aurantiacibacter sp. MUD11]|uniref:hypothetical protein n=1 Tax=Aurantiacibacter sp. MUD11 TaxID=3003265 RepID=UPI0022AB3169|nr:hypothetical protein [Aurantiacibacter sp. MUD11]WAT17108.1 hypothetical protein OZN62_09180 [Aurantiacibacter sp. MUD11]